MGLRVLVIALWAALAWAGQAAAQDQAWVQIEAQPSLAEAQDRAQAYAALFPDVAGFRVSSGWYAILLGPYPKADAAARLAALKQEGMIPGDSFLSDSGKLGEQFWPEDGAVAAPAPMATAEPAPAVEPTAPIEPEETLQQAKAAEAALTADERKALQEAMAWYGVYEGAIDGAFGPGTRKSMQAWQEAAGFAATGVLTTQQRGTLLANYQADKAEFGFESMNEAEAGIEITLPMGLLQFDHYEPPFVHYSEKDGSGLRLMLISQPGDAFTLSGLYDILQTLEVVPATGERSKSSDSFTINAASDTVQSYAYAEAKNGTVKGYLVVWKPADAERMTRILPVLKSSFRSFGDTALDPGLVPLDAATRAGLLAGLEVKTPTLSRSGFYVDAVGHVMTTTEAVAQCGRITIDHDTEASVLKADAATGLAILAPKTALAPVAFAHLQTGEARIGAEITVAGYSYEGRLPAPVLTFGTLEEAKGLNGEAGIARLSVPVLPGDSGGPVLDEGGAVLGMLLPTAVNGAKVLPDGVAFAASAQTVSDALAAAGIAATTAADANSHATPDALNAAGLGMTVLVSCWE